jgi:hypothetical protein
MKPQAFLANETSQRLKMFYYLISILFMAFSRFAELFYKGNSSNPKGISGVMLDILINP